MSTYRIIVEPTDYTLKRWSWKVQEKTEGGKWEEYFDFYNKNSGREKTFYKAQLAARYTLARLQAGDANRAFNSEIRTELRFEEEF